MTPAHPILMVAWLWPAAWMVLVAAKALPSRVRQSSTRLVVLLSLIVVAVFGAVVVWYVTTPSYYDKAEPSIAAVSATFLSGHVLYPALDAPERYAHVYGPVLFLTDAAVLRLIGSTIPASKVVGAAAILASLLVGFRLFTRRVGPAWALVASAACVGVYMDFGDVSFWTRADPLLILCSVLSWWVADECPTPVGVAVMAFLAGIAVNLKLTGPIYLLPALAMWSWRSGWRPVAIAGVVALPIAVAPFLAHGISALHYEQYVRLATRSGLEMSLVRHNLEWAAVLLLPAVTVSMGVRTKTTASVEMAVLSATLVAVSLVVVIAAKPGTGPYHLLPFVPGIVWLTVAGARRLPLGRAAIAATAGVVTTTMVLAVPRQLLVVETIRRRDRTPAAADLVAFVAAHPFRRISVGYSGKSFLPDARPVVVFATGEYWIDEPSVQEERLAGRDLPPATLSMIANCEVDYWLVPAGQPPFAVEDEYWPRGPREVFPPSFQQAFTMNYQRQGTTAFFDVWVCRHPSSDAAAVAGRIALATSGRASSGARRFPRRGGPTIP